MAPSNYINISLAPLAGNRINITVEYNATVLRLKQLFEQKEDLSPEIVKLYLVGGQYYLDNIDKFDFDTAIYHSLSIKKAVVDADEFEILERKSLNYGHSFGHVIEPLVNYKIPHGEAVMLGIEIINQLFTKSEAISNIVSKYTSLEKIKNIFFMY
jgi:3-dehydroquinate synthase